MEYRRGSWNGETVAELYYSWCICVMLQQKGFNMSKIIKYRDYIGSAKFSKEDNVFYGKVIGIPSLLLYEGESVADLIDDFRSIVDEYLDLCEEIGKEPESYSRNARARVDTIDNHTPHN